MKQEAIKDTIVAKLGEDVIKDSLIFRDELTVTVDRDDIVNICKFLRDDSDLRLDFLSFVGGVDLYLKEPRFEIVYQLFSTELNHRLRIKALVAESQDEPANINSVCEVWPSADWHERETAEMFGITFNNHPDPRKLLLPEDWSVYPLRKDFPIEGTEETPDLPGSGS